MRKEDLKIFENKKIKIFLKCNICYTGRILKINDDSVLILDKFNSEILINLSDLGQIVSLGSDL